MKKVEFIEALALKSGLSKQNCELMLDMTLELLKEQLLKGENVQFAGFGGFSIYERGARKTKIPGTDKFVDVDALRSVGFKAGKWLK